MAVRGPIHAISHFTTQWIGGRVGPQIVEGCVGKNKTSAFGIKPRFPSRADRCHYDGWVSEDPEEKFFA